MPMLGTDSRSEVDVSIFADERAIDLWDEGRVLGTWLGEQDDLAGDRLGPIVWDAFLLFGTDATWDSAAEHLLASGAPVIGETGTLARALQEAEEG